jgi:hypothetical protein
MNPYFMLAFKVIGKGAGRLFADKDLVVSSVARCKG